MQLLIDKLKSVKEEKKIQVEWLLKGASVVQCASKCI